MNTPAVQEKIMDYVNKNYDRSHYCQCVIECGEDISEYKSLAEFKRICAGYDDVYSDITSS